MTHQLFTQDIYAFADALPIILLEWDVAGNIHYLTPHGQNFFEYGIDELIGHSLIGTLFPDNVISQHTLESLIQHLKKNPQPYSHHQISNKKKDGQTVWISWHHVPILDSQQSIICIRSVGQDITLRKRTEYALVMSETKLNNLFHRASDCIVFYDTDGNILDINHKGLALFGYTKKEILTLKITDLQFPDAYHLNEQEYQSFVDSGFIRFETEFKTKEEKKFPAELAASIVGLEGKRLIQGVIRDLSAAKQRQTNLQKRNRVLETLNEMSQEVLQSLEMGPALNKVIRVAAETISVTSAYIIDWDPKIGVETVIAEYISPYANEKESVSDLGETYSTEEDFGNSEDWFLHSDYLIENIDDPDIDPEYKAHLEEYGGKTVLNVLLKWQDIRVGFLEFWETRYKRKFEPEEIELMQIIANQLAQNILNSRLFSALRISESRSDLVIAASPEPLAIYDLDEKFTLINPAFTTTFGWTKEDLLGRQVDLVEEEDRQTIKNIMRQDTKTDSNSLETKYLTKDGRWLDVLFSAAFFTDDDGKQTGALAIIRNITDRKQIEAERERLLLAERKQRRLAEILGTVGIALTAQTNLDNVLDEILIQANTLVSFVWADILLSDGVSGQFTLMRELDKVSNTQPIKRDLPVATFPLMNKFNRNRVPKIIANTQESSEWVASKNLQWVCSYMVVPFILRRRVIGFLRLYDEIPYAFNQGDIDRMTLLANAAVIAIDNAQLLIAEKQRVEALAKARDEAIKANNLKTDLVANVSHELRTPLGAIIGYADMLNAGIYGDVAEEQVEIIDEIIDSATYLTNMVNNLLDKAKLDAGKFTVEVIPFQILDLLTTVQNQMRVLAESKGLTLGISSGYDVPKRLFGDPVRLQQILINLIGNAIKFTHEGGVTVRVSRSERTHWVMHVMDTGGGIPPEAQARIFQAFEQVDSSHTRQTGGTGLGLSIVKQLVDLMDGHITLNSVAGEGSTFSVYLPLVPKSMI